MNHLNFVYFCTYLYKANKDGVVPVLLGFKPTPEYVEFNILWIACKETKGFFNKRRHRVSSSPCLLPSGLISLHINCANFFQQGKHELAYEKKKRTIFPLLFFSLLLGKHFGSGGGISLLCLMLLQHSVFPAKIRWEELLLLQL